MNTENWTPYDWLEFWIKAIGAVVIMGSFLAGCLYIGWKELMK